MRFLCDYYISNLKFVNSFFQTFVLFLIKYFNQSFLFFNIVTFDQVLVVGGDDLKVGDPTVAGATVEASVVKEGRAKKVIVYKYKRKTGYHKKNGHRQAFTQVKIEKING